MRTAFYLRMMMFFLFLSALSGYAKSLVWEEYPLKQYHEKVEIHFKESKSNYYTVTQDNPLEVQFRGPRKVLVHVRNTFTKNEAETQEYHLSILQDGRNFDEYVFRSKPSSSSVLASNPQLQLGKIRKFVVEVPEGVHVFRFFPPETMENHPFFLRFFVSEPTSKHDKKIAMSPEKYNQVVNLIYKEREFTYYRATKEKPLEIGVIGPTELKVISRLEFHRRIKGQFSYQIQVFQDDQLTQTRQYRTYKSDIVSYAKVTSLTPGRSRSFTISVPKGRHVYRLAPVALEKGSVLMKILIPRKDVGVVEE
ncbi:MAG: hypothetical protein HYS08_07395 [Chlamydiae bacterium]|nr:hypothetical protein [Chlamydiota bacterium]MBI3266320.1 hypothetical protein [Chlamydiota bacterium]